MIKQDAPYVPDREILIQREPTMFTRFLTKDRRKDYYFDIMDYYLTYRKYPHKLITQNVPEYAKASYKKTAEWFDDLRSMDDGAYYLEQRHLQVRDYQYPNEAVIESTPEKDIETIEEFVDKFAVTFLKNSAEVIGDTKNPAYLDLQKQFVKWLTDYNSKNNLIEAARRYLAVSCDICTYRVFVERGKEDTKLEGICNLCKYRNFAVAKGCEIFPYKTQLESKPKLKSGR